MVTPRIGSQRAAIKNFLELGNSITALQALGLFRAFRLAAQIEVLRNAYGMNIITEQCRDITGKEYARYFLRVPASYSGRDMIDGPVVVLGGARFA